MNCWSGSPFGRVRTGRGATVMGKTVALSHGGGEAFV